VIFDSIEIFKKNVESKKRLMGLDVGTKTIGVALSDRDWGIATPKLVIKRKSNEKDILIISDCINSNDVGGIVVGLPLTFNGEDSQCSIFIKKFVDVLNKKIDIPLCLHNELLTSSEAEGFLIDEMSMSFINTKKIVDKVAAANILQSVLDFVAF
jgi:putative Holliday junction resolvase